MLSSLRRLGAIVAALAHPGLPAQDPPRFDAIVYGGTSAGVVAAVQLANDGHTVLLIEPTAHLGGMSVCGLGATDVGNKEVIGGLSREFYRALRKHYDDASAWRQETRAKFEGHGHRAGEDAVWTFEPHVAEAIFDRWAQTERVTVWRRERLDRAVGVSKEGGLTKQGDRITELRCVSGRRATARLFLDATYEGDLMAAAGVAYAVGREANAKYGETLNGVQTKNAVHHQFAVPVDAYVVPGQPDSGLLPGVRASPGEEGAGDVGVQAYCFRICATDVPANRRPWPEPEGYDERAYELLLRNFAAGDRQFPWHPVLMPNRKTDANNNKAVSTDWIGMNWRYPEADDAERAQIVADHLRYTQGLMWTLANHPRVPSEVREHFQAWGLARDEFQDHDNWPYQFYVREGRRMLGTMVMTERHCRGQLPVAESVGMGAYNMDSHNVQRHVDAQGKVRNEGDVQVRVAPYGIALGALVPQRGQCRNLLVPVALSASHIAYGSIRMEPVFMVLAQSAAIAGSLALRADLAVQDVTYAQLRPRLLAAGQVLEHRPAAEKGLAVASLAGHVQDDAQAEVEGAWLSSDAVMPFVGSGYRHDGNTGKDQLRARFVVGLPGGGDYAVQIAFTAHDNRASNVPVTVHALAGSDTVAVDQRRKPTIDGLWHEVGVYRFGADGRAVVEIGNAGTDGHVVIDAVRALRR
jgi:hypothetical protein